MKKFIYTAALLVSVTLTGAAVAGPEPISSKDKTIVQQAPPPCTWQGFYIGINGGYAFSQHNDVTDLDFLNVGPPAESFSFDSDGGVAGGQMGYNWQPLHWLVLGAEGDGGYFGLNGRKTQPGSPNNATFAEINPGAYATARGRVGVAFNCLLVYATGGWFGSDYERRIVDNELCTCGGTLGHADNEDWRSGYTVGGGLEWMFRHHWTVRVEYLYFNLDNSDVAVKIDQAGYFHFGFHDDGGHIVRAGLNYKF